MRTALPDGGWQDSLNPTPPWAGKRKGIPLHRRGVRRSLTGWLRGQRECQYHPYRRIQTTPPLRGTPAWEGKRKGIPLWVRGA